MKYGIVTCGLEPNYGACLQSYATQKIIDNLGIENELINYSFLEEDSYSPFKQPSLKSALSCVLFYRLRKSNHFAFQNFRKAFMRYSENRVKNESEFTRILNEYEGILVGSDQVWNPFLGIDINITLLNFYKSKNGPRKLSYASSFGIETIPEELEEKYRISFNDFNSISVREETGRAIVSKLTGKDVPVVVDPCGLLQNQEWESIENNDKTPNDPYVLVYDMRHDPALFDFSINYGKKLGCKVMGLSRIIIPRKEIKTLYGVSPDQFISLIHNAKCVITDSFHGTLFSVIFNKPFYTFCNKEGAKIGSRITNLLSRLQLEKRLIIDGGNGVVDSTDIDYKSVDSLLSAWREKSLSYLKRCLLENKQ